MKRFTLLIFSLLALGLALILPATTEASTIYVPPTAVTTSNSEGLYCEPRGVTSITQQEQIVAVAKKMEKMNNLTTITPELRALTAQYYSLLAKYDTCTKQTD